MKEFQNNVHGVKMLIMCVISENLEKSLCKATTDESFISLNLDLKKTTFSQFKFDVFVIFHCENHSLNYLNFTHHANFFGITTRLTPYDNCRGSV